MRSSMLCVAACVVAAPAFAGEKPRYAPAPDWVTAPLTIDPAKLGADGPVVLFLDNQQRFQDGTVTVYSDTALRATSAQVLAQIGTITLPWIPDKGDLTIHKVEIIRGAEHIDVLKGGEPFSVLRREQQLEQLQMTGILTATFPVQGLQVGDILHASFSVTQRDGALGGQMQGVLPLVVDPVPIANARTRLVWPTASNVRWRTYADAAKPVIKTSGGQTELTLQMPLAKAADMPSDAPVRYRKLPIIEATSFASWTEVSKTMAPLYATDGLIAAGGPIAAAVAKITQGEATQRGRAQAALRLVQDEIRYLALGMNGGNYVPQKPTDTWQLKYGDCKAKTLLLLAMLRAMDIEAEPVFASVQMSGFVADRLPSVMAFDHVIVHAKIDGKDLWLDGTDNGGRIGDLDDTPAFRTVLPVRTAGAELMPLVAHANGRPDMLIETEYDQSAGLDFPTLFRTKLVLRGRTATMLADASASANAEQKRELLQSAVGRYIGEAQVTDGNVRRDLDNGTTIVTASGLISTMWRREQKRYRATIDHAIDDLDFEPDRARPAWRDIPVATDGPESRAYRTTFRLPAGGAGYAFEGDQSLSGKYAGAAITRTSALKDGVITVDERVDTTGAEIAPAEIAAERARVALAKGRLLRVIAPETLMPRWKQVQAANKDGRFKPIEAAFGQAIAADPKEVTGYSSRASFRAGTYDYRGAIADVSKMIEIEPTVALYLRRAGLYGAVGDDAKSLADINTARELEPSSLPALSMLAGHKARHGEGTAALALIQERIDQGGKDRFGLLASKADIQGRMGKPDEAVATYDSVIAERPGDPELLNGRCWLKGTRNVALDTALKDCTKSIELAESPAAALDSRAMVYFRMGRMEDALADLDAALDVAPNLASSLFLRSVIYKRMGRTGEATEDLTGARIIEPRIDEEYKSYGITA